MKEELWLQEGQQTSKTKAIIDTAYKIDGEDFEFVLNLLDWVRKNLQANPNGVLKKDVFRTRTADEIIKNQYSSGCTDTAIVFIALARAKDIPTKYLETVSRFWLEKKDMSSLHGHVFAKVYIKNRWYLVDPESGWISVKAIPNKNLFLVSAEGLDSWGIGIKNFKDIKDHFQKYIKEKG